MPADKNSPRRSQYLTGSLTVDEARRMLRNEGGELPRTELILQLLSLAAVSALTARAIHVGHATVWHLALPMVAQYLAMTAALPVIYAAVRHPGLRNMAAGSLAVLAALAAAIAMLVARQAHQQGAPWREQFRVEVARAWHWTTDAEMHWPLLLAALGMLAALPARVRNLTVHGPPFIGAGLGCVLRAGVLLVGCVLLPWALKSSTRMAWFVWTAILIAEALALWMRWDLQQRLHKLDGE
jgi:hypothetical protein